MRVHFSIRPAPAGRGYRKLLVRDSFQPVPVDIKCSFDSFTRFDDVHTIIVMSLRGAWRTARKGDVAIPLAMQNEEIAVLSLGMTILLFWFTILKLTLLNE